jgi:hypothetical protein
MNTGLKEILTFFPMVAIDFCHSYFVVFVIVFPCLQGVVYGPDRNQSIQQ